MLYQEFTEVCRQMKYQTQFTEACEHGNLTDIIYLLNTDSVNVHADNEIGFKLACFYGHLNVVQFLLTKTKTTNKMLKILNKSKYFKEIKKHTRCVKIFDHRLRLCKILFPLYNTINVKNSIYLGLI